MNFDELVKANKLIKTTDIKGKKYVEVNERIKVFRILFPNGTISTEILSVENGVVIFKATAMDEEGHVLGVGHAYEKEDSSFINKTSYIENAETSAVGRALGMIGIGIDVSLASYEEVANAIENQKKKKDSGVKKENVKKEVNEEVVEDIADEFVEIIDHRKELRDFIISHDLKGSDMEKKIIKDCKLDKYSTDEDYAMALVYAKNLIGE